MSISLGCYESNIDSTVLDRFRADVEKYAGHTSGKLMCDTGSALLRPLDSADISGLQLFLVTAGFFPDGKIDGICGYRTHSAIRLFQEYVRSQEKRKCLPDGIAGPVTLKHVSRWQQQQKSAEWNPLLIQWKKRQTMPKGTSCARWMSFLNKITSHYQQNPTSQTNLVNKFRKKTDSRKPQDWAYPKEQIHLIGIRRKEKDAKRKFDDVFVLLARGLVFKFQGSTDPGSTNHKDGAPFLLSGQHDYRFGLHQGKYHALRPLNYNKHGVLVVRSKGDFKLSDKDLRQGAQTNGSINIHWGGKGVGRGVNRWSAGCQVITGSGYEDFEGRIINCASYVALTNGEISKQKGRKTRGAYNVLTDILIAFGSGLPNPGQVSYTLLHETDCALDAAISEEIGNSLQGARTFIDKIS